MSIFAEVTSAPNMDLPSLFTVLLCFILLGLRLRYNSKSEEYVESYLVEGKIDVRERRRNCCCKVHEQSITYKATDS